MTYVRNFDSSEIVQQPSLSNRERVIRVLLPFIDMPLPIGGDYAVGSNISHRALCRVKDVDTNWTPSNISASFHFPQQM